MLNAISRYGVRVVPDTVQIVTELERHGQMVEGPHVAELEGAFARRFGHARAVSASYGRMAFFYILRALDFPPGSEVVFPALTFWVMPEMARVAGLTPVFADVDPDTFNVTPSTLERAITARTVAVVPTHLWGLPCDMDDIVDIASRRDIRVIEDCAHALGARYRDRPVGTFGDAAIFSLQTLKPLNAYGGGMAVTRDAVLGARVAAIAGAEPPPARRTVQDRMWKGRVMRIATRPHVFTWTLFPLMYACTRLHWSLDMYFWERIRPLDPMPADYRERLSNGQAAIALAGLSHLDDWTTRTRRHAERMSAVLRSVPGVQVPIVPPDRTHAFYQYCAYVPARDAVVDACLRRGVDIETLHVDVCTELNLFGAPATVAHGARATTQTIQIPVSESLTDAHLDRVATVVRDSVVSLLHEEPVAVHQS
jgi:dTDP-4-amino-4,6-dideoxygalactose transaminase